MAFGSQNSAALNVASQAGIITKGKDIFDSSHNCGREISFELMGGSLVLWDSRHLFFGDFIIPCERLI